MKRANSAIPKRPGRFTLPLLALAAVVLLSFAGVTAARYVMREEHTGIAGAEEFYFTSDLLKEAGTEAPSYYIDPQADTLSISLFNYADDRRTNGSAIQYHVSVIGGAANPASGTLAGGQQSQETIVITPGTKGAGDITVTVSSTSPYAKTLTAQFKPALGNQYTVEDRGGNTAAVLTITCADSAKGIALSLPSGVIPDATDSRVSAADGGYLFQSPGPGVYSLVLLKSNTGQNLSGSGAFADHINIALT